MSKEVVSNVNLPTLWREEQQRQADMRNGERAFEHLDLAIHEVKSIPFDFPYDSGDQYIISFTYNYT